MNRDNNSEELETEDVGTKSEQTIDDAGDTSVSVRVCKATRYVTKVIDIKRPATKELWSNH